MKKMTKAKLNRLVTQSKRFTLTSRKGGKEERDAKSNYNRRRSDMHYLHCVNLWRNLHAKGCDTYAGLTISDYPKVFAKGAVIVIGENASETKHRW
jgi:hypothetical protein